MLLLSPACPPAHAGLASLPPRPVSSSGPRPVPWALLGLAPCPSRPGSLGARGSGAAAQRCVSTLCLHRLLSGASANSYAPASRCLGLWQGGERPCWPLGKLKLWAFLFGSLGALLCAALQAPPHGALDRPSPFTLPPAPPDARGTRAPTVRSGPPPPPRLYPHSYMTDAGPPRLKNIHPELPLFHLNSLQLS